MDKTSILSNFRIILKSSATAPRRYNVYVKYKHFTHGATFDFFSVNSYTGQVEYEDIPDYRPDQRTIVNLRDVVDFRGIKHLIVVRLQVHLLTLTIYLQQVIL